MCVCACMCACACMCVRVCMYACVSACMCVRVCIHVCMHVCVCACMCVCVRACVHACVCACVRVFVRACVYMYNPLSSCCMFFTSKQLPNLSEIGPPLKICPPPFLNEVIAKRAFLSKVRPPTCAVVHAVMLSKKHRRNSTFQEDGLTNEGRHHLLLLRK